MNYHGETTCAHLGCERPAYYAIADEPRCGHHARKGTPGRRALPKNPATLQAKEQAKAERIRLVQVAADKNSAAGLRGQLKLRHYSQREPFEPTPGFAIVWPNDSRPRVAVDLWVPALSPKRLGPVETGQPNTPPALTIEAAHQQSKCWPHEVGLDGFPLPEFFVRRNAAFQDPERAKWRWTFGATKAEHLKTSPVPEGNPNVPAFFVWVANDGTVQRLSYVESRIYYCTFYSQLAPATEDFVLLQEMLDSGINCEIWGFDAPNGAPDADQLRQSYLDPSWPFGHEVCLYALLQGLAPWRNV